MCKTVKNKNKQNVLHMFASQHLILPKVIGYLFHLHFYLFNSQKRICLNTKKEISKDKKGKYQKTKREVSKDKRGSIKRQKRKHQKTKEEVSKDKRGSIKRQKTKYQKTKNEVSKDKKKK